MAQHSHFHLPYWAFVDTGLQHLQADSQEQDLHRLEGLRQAVEGSLVDCNEAAAGKLRAHHQVVVERRSSEDRTGRHGRTQRLEEAMAYKVLDHSPPRMDRDHVQLAVPHIL